MFSDVSSRIRRALDRLSRYGVVCSIGVDELLAYLRGPTYSGDRTPAEAVLSSDILMLHEVAEICILKSMGYSIDENTVLRAYPDTYRVHLEALRVELREAFEEGLNEWVEARCRDLQTYLKDPHLPKSLEGVVRSLIEDFCSGQVAGRRSS